MKLKETDILKILSDGKFEDFHSIGIIDEIALRTYLLQYEYKQLRKMHTQFESIYILSQEYNLAFATVNTILFRKRIKKTFHIEKHLDNFSNTN
jgi:hypothetical protein